MHIMLTDEIAGSAQPNAVVRLHLGSTCICVLRAQRLTAGADGVSRALTSVQPMRAANGNQLVWPYLAFADDWYAAC
jgi:hypothetical protein